MSRRQEYMNFPIGEMAVTNWQGAVNEARTEAITREGLRQDIAKKKLDIDLARQKAPFEMIKLAAEIQQMRENTSQRALTNEKLAMERNEGLWQNQIREKNAELLDKTTQTMNNMDRSLGDRALHQDPQLYGELRNAVVNKDLAGFARVAQQLQMGPQGHLIVQGKEYAQLFDSMHKIGESETVQIGVNEDGSPMTVTGSEALAKGYFTTPTHEARVLEGDARQEAEILQVKAIEAFKTGKFPDMDGARQYVEELGSFRALEKQATAFYERTLSEFFENIQTSPDVDSGKLMAQMQEIRDTWPGNIDEWMDEKEISESLRPQIRNHLTLLFKGGQQNAVATALSIKMNTAKREGLTPTRHQNKLDLNKAILEARRSRILGGSKQWAAGQALYTEARSVVTASLTEVDELLAGKLSEAVYHKLLKTRDELEGVEIALSTDALKQAKYGAGGIKQLMGLPGKVKAMVGGDIPAYKRGREFVDSVLLFSEDKELSTSESLKEADRVMEFIYNIYAPDLVLSNVNQQQMLRDEQKRLGKEIEAHRAIGKSTASSPDASALNLYTD